MSLHSWLHNSHGTFALYPAQNKHARRRALRAAVLRPIFEPLEDRCLLAFLAPVDYAAGSAPMQVVSADFNNDDATDLAVLNFDNAVSLLLNNGDGTFQAPVSYRTAGSSNRPISMAVGDLDGDGNIDDLAIANYGYGYGYSSSYPADVRILTGQDDGTLRSAGNPFAGYGRAASVAVGDFNGDGKMDLGVTVNDYYYHSGGWLSSVNVLLGTGGAVFSAPKSTFVGRPLIGGLTTDLNGDAYEDFVTWAPNWDSGGYYVLELRGTSSGFLQGPSCICVQSDTYGPYGVQGDFTGDGILDVFTNGSILYGQSDGTFSSPELIGSNLGGGAAGDFNGDGWLDLAALNQNGRVSVLINDRIWLGPPPSLTIRDAAVTEGHSGTVAARFEVTLSSNPAEPVIVNYTTADGSATAADGDYQSKAGTLTFNPGGPLTQTITVLVNGDRRGEIGDLFYVNITSADAPVIDGQATGIIIEDEPTLYIGPASAFEGNIGTTPFNFTLTLSAPYDTNITVRFATQDGSATTADGDYQASSGTATIPAGATTKTITINVKGDEKVEADETFLVILSNASSAYISDSGTQTGFINNDDTVTKFYVVDASSDRTYEYDRNGAPVENYRLASGNNDPRGVASDATGQRVWVVDNDKYVDVYNNSGGSLGYWKANGLNKPEGIASNGTDIWIVDRQSDRVYRYAGAANRTSGSANPTSNFALASGNRDATGIETDGTYLWVVDDSGSNKVFKYTLSGTLVGSWTISGANTTPTGITLDPSNPSDIWIVDSGRDQVFQYTAAASRTSGSQAPSAVFNLAPGNTNPQGIADPPAPVGQASKPSTPAWNADLRGAAAGLQSSLNLTASSATTAQPRARTDVARPSDGIPWIVTQRPRDLSASGSAARVPDGKTVSELVRLRNNENNVYVSPHDAVFADIERLNNNLHGDSR